MQTTAAATTKTTTPTPSPSPLPTTKEPERRATGKGRTYYGLRTKQTCFHYCCDWSNHVHTMVSYGEEATRYTAYLEG